jgi:hypothetical protein
VSAGQACLAKLVRSGLSGNGKVPGLERRHPQGAAVSIYERFDYLSELMTR